MPIPAFRTKQTTSTTGTGTLTLNAASPEFRSLTSTFGGASVKVRYILSRSGIYEVGYGTFNGSNQLTRDTVIASSNAGALVSLAAGDTDGADAVFPWQTIVFESMTHYCAMLQDEISQNGMQKMDQQRWGLISDHLRAVHSRLRGLDCHVVFTALSKVEGEERSAEGLPDISGKMARMLPAACDAIGFCECVEGGGSKANAVYRIYFRQHRVYLARTRFRDMPPMIENFHFNDVARFTSAKGL